MNITLALGGGGVKGFAHIGALRVIQKEGFHILGVAGTSAGGLVGALYAAGYSADDMAVRLQGIDQGNLFSRMHGDAPSLLGFSGVIEILSELLGERHFEDLRVPLALTATDLSTGLPVTIKAGRLLDAVLATSAAPGVFPARKINGHLYVDGGILNPIPVNDARALAPEAPVVAIVLSLPSGVQAVGIGVNGGNIPMLMTNLPLVYRLAGRLQLAQAFNLFIHSMDLAGLMLLDKQLKLEKPEVIIRPDVGAIGLVDRVDIAGLIKAGEQAANDALPVIRRAAGWKHQLQRKVTRLFFQG